MVENREIFCYSKKDKNRLEENEMASLLLPVIYLAFISLGLPDPLLGAAWPEICAQWGTPASLMGVVTMIISAGTIFSSLMSERLYFAFGPGKVTAFSVFLTAVGLLGFSFSGAFWMLCVAAVPYGLGAGGVDSVLNNYVALHYKARHMSWLHCMWGIGCSAGPLIMSAAISGGSWNNGYLTIAVMQGVLTLVLVLSLPLWKKSGAETSKGPAVKSKLIDILKIPGVKEVLFCFFCYCALESVAGMWAASYCAIFRGIPSEEAAGWASLMYIGITVGRFLSGFVTFKVNDRNMIRLGQGFVAAGVVLLLLPFEPLLPVGLILVGFGCAPIYPSIIHETPSNFGEERSQGIIGVQMAFAYVGSLAVPPLFGLLADHISFGLFPLFLGGLLLLMFVMAERLHQITGARREKSQVGVEAL